MDYFVTWTIEMDADNPQEAAARALIVQRDTDPANTATVFKVMDMATGLVTTVDLTRDTEHPSALDTDPSALDTD